MAKFEVVQVVSRGGYQIFPDTEYDTVDFSQSFIDMLTNEKIISYKGTETPLQDQIKSLQAKTSRFGYNLNSALLNYRIALSNIQNQLVKVYCVGDSITRGEYASNEPTKSWVGQLRALLQAQYGGSGEGFIGVYEATLPGGAAPRWALGSGWNNSAGGGFGGYFADSGTGGTNVNPSTVTFTGDKVSLLYAKASDGGTADVKIDGVSKGTINCQNALTDFTAILNLTGLGAGAHTMTITPTGNGKVFIEGIIEGGGATSGIQVNRIGRSSWKVSDWNANPTKTFARWTSLPPNLAIIALGMNDVKSVDVETYKTQMATLINQFKNSGSSVILLAYFQPSSGWVANSRWEDYVNAMYALADKYDCGLIDMFQSWGKSYTLAQAQGLFGPSSNDYSGASGTNTAHPGDKGYNYIAQVIKPHLTL